MAKSLLILFSLCIISATTVFADECTIQQNMTKTQVRKQIGEPDWIQANNKDCWAYFNSGTEIMFKNDRLYAVRYRRGSLFLPSFLEQAAVILGGIKKNFPKLGNPVDSSVGKWETEMYSDKKTYAVAINFNKYSHYLDNVLVQQSQYHVYCDGYVQQSDSKLYKKWFKVGTYVKNYLEVKTLNNKADILRLKKNLTNVVSGKNSQPLNALFNESSQNGDYSALAMQLRDLLIETATQEGREVHSHEPVAAFLDGMYASLLATDLKLKDDASFAEAQNHFSGLSMARRNKNSHEIDQLLSAIQSGNSNKMKEASKSFMRRVNSL